MALSQSEQKVLAATTAVDSLISEGLIFSGMKIGLGTGSTAMPAVKRLAERIARLLQQVSRQHLPVRILEFLCILLMTVQ